MKDVTKRTYILGIANTDSNGVHMEKFIGTEQEVKKHLASIIREDKNADKSSWDMGSKLKDLTVDPNGAIQGYNIYHDYHIDYTAIPEEALVTTEL